MARLLRIFVLADTHNKLPKRILDLAREADEIWHLGDVCEPTISGDLEAIGTPVTIVRGNCDCNSAGSVCSEGLVSISSMLAI